MKQRIWELDAFRGLCVLGMVAVHLVYDVVDLYRLVNWQYPALFSFVKDWGGVLFLLISGISATLGSRSLKRGMLVFGCGMAVTAVTVGMYLLNLAGMGIIIYFGVLQCLGVCMMLWTLCKKLPTWALAVLGIAMVAAGLYLRGRALVDFPWLIPLGVTPRNFASSDYFPLLPNLGFFLLGAVLGRIVYRRKESLLPQVGEGNPLRRLLCFFGKHSLLIYMLHQPVLSGIVGLIAMLMG